MCVYVCIPVVLLGKLKHCTSCGTKPWLLAWISKHSSDWWLISPIKCQGHPLATDHWLSRWNGEPHPTFLSRSMPPPLSYTNLHSFIHSTLSSPNTLFLWRDWRREALLQGLFNSIQWALLASLGRYAYIAKACKSRQWKNIGFHNSQLIPLSPSLFH